MVKYTIDEVELAWTDMGKKMWFVFVVHENGDRGYFKLWARDELDAYNIINKQLLEREQANG